MKRNAVENFDGLAAADASHIRAIVFDLDGVLIPEDDATRQAFETTCSLAVATDDPRHQLLVTAVRSVARSLWQTGPAAAYCRQIGASSSEGLCATFSGDGDDLLVLREWAPQYRRRVWEGGLANVGITDAAVAATLADHFSELRAMHYRPYPDVLPALVQLSQRYRLGLITNGLPDLQRTKLRFAQLHHRFSPLLISGELGVGKPMVQVYKHLLNALRLPPEQVLLVEDSLTNIEGAARLGIQAVHVTRGTVSPSCRTIGSLNDLTTLLGC